MPHVYLALGSNIEPRERYLCRAVDLLKQVGAIEKLAPLYETSPYGIAQQPYFLNSALLLKTVQEPLALLRTLKELELRLGRRHRQRWGPREIDLDIIFYDQLILLSDELIIPHPDYRNRRFVLQPLVDMAPSFVAPDAGEPLKSLLAQCPDQTQLRMYKKDWMPNENENGSIALHCH